MSIRADLIGTFSSLPNEYGLTKKQAAELYATVLLDLEWEEYDEFTNEDAYKELFGED